MTSTCALLLVLLSVVSVHADHYTTLGVERSASQAEIRRAYRALAIALHPDKNGADADAAKRFSEVTAAYEVLIDADSRQIYDDYGEERYHSQWQFAQAANAGKAKATQRDFYSTADDVLKVTMDTWHLLGPVSVVEFYAPWCSHCQLFVPGFKRTALMLEGKVTFGAVNCEKQQRLCQNLGIQQYPTIRFFRNGADFDDFTGAHTTEALYAWTLGQLSTELITLTPSNFHELVIAPKEPWIVDFSAGAWCGPCTIAKQRLRRFANEVRGRMRVGIVDCDQFAAFCVQQNVGYYPNLRAFGPTAYSGSELAYSNEQQYPVVTMLDIMSNMLLAMSEPTLKVTPTDDESAQSASDSHSSEL